LGQNSVFYAFILDLWEEINFYLAINCEHKLTLTLFKRRLSRAEEIEGFLTVLVVKIPPSVKKAFLNQKRLKQTFGELSKFPERVLPLKLSKSL
jgi:hypothetical protein